MIPHSLYEGTFDSGMTIAGKVVSSWHVTDTAHTLYVFGRSYRKVCIMFADGSRAHIDAVRDL